MNPYQHTGSYPYGHSPYGGAPSQSSSSSRRSSNQGSGGGGRGGGNGGRDPTPPNPNQSGPSTPKWQCDICHQCVSSHSCFQFYFATFPRLVVFLPYAGSNSFSNVLCRSPTAIGLLQRRLRLSSTRKWCITDINAECAPVSSPQKLPAVDT